MYNDSPHRGIKGKTPNQVWNDTNEQHIQNMKDTINNDIYIQNIQNMKDTINNVNYERYYK